MSLFTATALYNYQPIVSGFDPDAQAFITATGITGSNATAINTLVVDLKGYGLWTKMNVIYPFIGGTATTNKYNLINPADTNAAFRIQFNGTVTHNFSGSAGNGSGGYGRTYYAPSGNVTLNSEHISCYINTNNANAQSDTVELGVNQSSNTQASIFGVKTGGNFGARLNQQAITYANTDAKGFYTITKNGTTIAKAYKGSTLQTTVNPSTGTLPTINILLWTAAVNTDSPYTNGYSNQSFAFTSFGDGLSDTDVSNLYTVVQAYQTTLGRQV
jgi:hypothetical protein